MSGKWFSNRGQVLQILVAFVAWVVGILVAVPQLPVQQGFQGFLSAWSIIIFPLVALVLMWLNNKRMHRTIETLVQKTPQVSEPAATETELVKSKVPYADLFPKRSGAREDGWRITEVYVVDVRVKAGSYWEEPITKNKSVFRLSRRGARTVSRAGCQDPRLNSLRWQAVRSSWNKPLHSDHIRFGFRR
jgi:hypothetical protein